MSTQRAVIRKALAVTIVTICGLMSLNLYYEHPKKIAVPVTSSGIRQGIMFESINFNAAR